LDHSSYNFHPNQRSYGPSDFSFLKEKAWLRYRQPRGSSARYAGNLYSRSSIPLLNLCVASANIIDLKLMPSINCLVIMTPNFVLVSSTPQPLRRSWRTQKKTLLRRKRWDFKVFRCDIRLLCLEGDQSVKALNVELLEGISTSTPRLRRKRKDTD
jgi:hypothetical protein